MVNENDINSIAVVGAGTMGKEIAQVALMAGFEKVYLNDINKETLNSAINIIRNNLLKLEKKGKLNNGITTEDLMKKLKATLELSKVVSRAELVIEAIPEKMELKQALFKKLGELTPKSTILASNTSTMSISEIASSSGKEDKVVGMHFFIPVVVLRLIEVIKGKKTSDEVFETSIKVAKRFPSLKGKRYVARIEKETPGFIVNRLTIATSLYLSWLLDHASENGIEIEKIDNDVAKSPELGPYAKWDYLGLDVVCNALNYFNKTVSEEFRPGKVLTKLVNEGKLGKKTGEGLYKWVEEKPIRKTEERANLFDINLYYAIQLNEGCRLLGEGVVKNYKVIDDTMLAGMDMPGPFSAGKRNYEKWTKLLEQFSKQSNLTYILPCELMRTGKFLQMKK
ncbi:MAG: 3-hydroxyacyl-CoA dehydrogenase family protein [Promethearchaeota archaeon]